MDIFVSYASEQRAVAEEIALALRGEGHEVFLDRSELPEGDAYNAGIRKAIAACDLLVFLLSPESVSAGRYTLTELKFAEEKWRAPAGRVLPVMVRSTDTATMPAYLRAVVILRPAGNVPAEVVAAVDRLTKPRWVRIVLRYGVALAVVVLVGGGFGTWRAVERWRDCDEALRLVRQAKMQQEAGDYAAAWDRYADGLALCPNNGEVIGGQERLAMDWLENIRATVGKQTFTDIVDKVQAVLSRAATAKDDRLAADALAHLGWGDFLRSRDGQGGRDPVHYYQQALQREPDNGYAHAFLGHHILAHGGDVAQAKMHFDKALASRAPRPFVRGIQISALLWGSDNDLQVEVVRVANDMRIKGEPWAAASAEARTSGIWTIYYRRLMYRRDAETEAFFAAAPAKDLLDTFVWLFPAYDNFSNGVPYRFMLAQLQEHSGARLDALASYRAVLAMLTARESASSGPLPDATRQAIRRLQSP